LNCAAAFGAQFFSKASSCEERSIKPSRLKFASRRMASAMKALVALMLFLVQSPNKHVLFFSFDRDSFSATGKWASTSSNPKDQIAHPQEVQIDCFRANRQCIEATAEYYMGNPHISISYLTIVQWDKDGIIAVSSAGVCLTNKLIFNFADKSITALDVPKQLTEDLKKSCAFFGAGEAPPPFTFVVRGSPRWEKEHVLSIR
jgi:hypothetical protein